MTTHHASSDKILYLLKITGPQTAKTLAEQLQMTSMGARQHLLHLESQGMVSSFSRAEKVGRPSQYWQLTEQAQQRFPDSHGQLTLHLIQAVKNRFGEEGMDQLIAQREQDMLPVYQQKLASATGLEQKLEALSQLRSEEGYMAAWQMGENGDYWFLENHCPICAAANECQSFCRSELDLFQACLGNDVKVERKEHILSGARRCAYLITPA